MNLWLNTVEPGFDKVIKWIYSADPLQPRSRLSIESLPPDILLEVAYNLEERGDRLQFALTVRPQCRLTRTPQQKVTPTHATVPAPIPSRAAIHLLLGRSAWLHSMREHALHAL